MNNLITELSLECNIILIIEIRKAIPPHLFKKNEVRFLVSVAQSLSCTITLVHLGYNFIPISWYALPIWIVFDLQWGSVLKILR
jgi:omega-6 fatty acid desaturase (delta-12 desaturase)